MRLKCAHQRGRKRREGRRMCRGYGVNESETNYFRPLSSSPDKAFQTYPVTDAAY